MSAQGWEHELVAELRRLADPNNPNRAVLAHLRRGVGCPLDYTLAHVGWLFREVPDYALSNAVFAAGLFAWAKGGSRHTDGVSFGAAFGKNLSQDEKERREKRFVDLLDTDGDELHYKLRQAITLIARDGVGVDWALFIKDLRGWNDPGRRVQKKWARDFWAAPESRPNANPTQLVSP